MTAKEARADELHDNAEMSTPPAKAARRRVERKAANHEAKRRQILDVAGELFLRKGYANSSIDEIAAALGVGKPFIYYYFSDKLTIFETLCVESSNLTSQAFESLASDDRSSTNRLRDGLYELIVRYLHSFAGGALYYKENALLTGTAAEIVRKNALKLHQDLTEILEDGRKTGEFAFEDTKLTALLIGGSIGFMFNWYRSDGKMAPEGLARSMAQHLLKSVSAPVKRGKTSAGAGSKVGVIKDETRGSVN